MIHIIEYGKKRKPISVIIKSKEGLFVAENKYLWVFGTGESVNKAIEDFYEQLEHFIDFYTITPEKELNKDAIILKKRYMKIFGEN